MSILPHSLAAKEWAFSKKVVPAASAVMPTVSQDKHPPKWTGEDQGVANSQEKHYNTWSLFSSGVAGWILQQQRENTYTDTVCVQICTMFRAWNRVLHRLRNRNIFWTNITYILFFYPVKLLWVLSREKTWYAKSRDQCFGCRGDGQIAQSTRQKSRTHKIPYSPQLEVLQYIYPGGW